MACFSCVPLRALLPICSQALPCTPFAPRSPASSRLPVLFTSFHTVCPPFDSRQYASAFNQPLSFETSGVTSMAYMFFVRSSPCPAPNLQSSPPLHTICTAVARLLPPPGTLHLFPHRMPSIRLSAVRASVQPAPELRNVRRHKHDLHVQRALLPEPCSQSAVKPSPARRVHRGRPPPPAGTLHLARTVCSPFGSRQSASAFDQPLSFDTSSVTNMKTMFYVRSSPCPAPNLQSTPPLHAACAAVARGPPVS